MVKTILVPLEGRSGDQIALETAHLAAQIFSSHLDCLFVRLDPVEIAARTATLDIDVPNIAPEIWAVLEQQEDARRDAAHRAFTAFSHAKGIEPASSPAKSSAISAAWNEITGNATDETVHHARVSELVVMARASDFEGSLTRIGEVLVRSGRPVILAPRSAPGTLGSTIAIAWKDTAEAARALTASMPFLVKARKVVLISADEGDGLAAGSADRLMRALEWRGIDAALRCLTRTHDTSMQILDAAGKEGADLLVMGGYSHSRAQELIFGGVTRSVIRDAPLPVLMCH